MRRRHGASQQVKIPGARVACRRQVEVLQDLQDLDHGHAAARRIVRSHDITAIAPLDRNAGLRLIRREVLARDIRPVRLEVGEDLVGKRAGIEIRPTLTCHALQRASVVRQAHHLARLV
jgi:hypothetical protein